MWESLRLPVDGNFLHRKIATFFTAIIAIIVGFLLMSATVLAIDAGWDGDTVIVNGSRYDKSTDSIPGIPSGSLEYVNKDATGKKASVVYFPSGSNIETATGAQYVIYDYNPPSSFTNPRGQESVAVAPKNGSQARSLSSTGDNLTGENRTGQATSCAITGIGWIVCPTTKIIASGMDKIFDLIKGFFEVKTITLDTDNATYRMWDVMRGFANLCFILAFLVIIYSQITSYGINNYEIKKMIPKLIIAAVLVNVSYYVCAAAVDISNILGNSLQQMFIDMRGQIVGPNTRANSAATSWESVSTFILSGGALAAAGITSAGIAIASGASILSLSVILVPFLLGVVFAAIIALLVLAARQALIVILITIAPLAFVALLLPSTEKWFNRWRELLTTMLIMFPMFALVFGGSQLAGGLIIQSADSITTMLIGMFVQVAPLAITPFLLKFSGSLLGRIAGLANNRQKGFIDRTRNALGEQDQRRRNRRMAEGYEQMANGRGRLGMGMTKRWAARRNDAKHIKEADDKAYKSVIDARGDAHWKERLFHEDSEGSQTVFTPSGQRRRRTKSVRNAYASTYGYQSMSDMLDTYDKRNKEEAKAGSDDNFYGNYGRMSGGSDDRRGVSVGNAVKNAALETAIDSQAAQSAIRFQNRDISAQLEADQSLRVRAGGIDTQYGQSRALANAINTRVSERSEGLKHIATMIEVTNPSAYHMHDFATRPIGDVVNGIEINSEVKEAAIKMVAGGPNVMGIQELAKTIDLSENSDPYWRTAFVDALKTNSSRPRYFNAALMDELGQGKPGGLGTAGIEAAIRDALKANTYDARGMISEDKAALEMVEQFLRKPEARDPQIQYNVREAILGIASDREARNSMGKRKPVIESMALSVGIDLNNLPDGLKWNV